MSAERHEKLTALFSEAVDLAEPERAALIARVRRDDASLADELAALLSADAATYLQTGGLSPAVDRRLSRPGIPLFQVPGYRVLDILGEGGMGTVYAGEQEEPKRRVAIKVLHARSPSAVARFKAEAQIMARLDHPGIARVLEAGQAGDQPYLVMEHVDGVTLDAHVAKLPQQQRLELFVAMCDAVHHAHVKGVIHRDLKPANVMVRADGRIVILDFGVARLAADDGKTPGDTRAGELIGTPLYMSPEQAALRAADVDARSDVYTLGVMLYELLCGELPYDVRGLPLPAVTVIITEEPPVALGKRDPALAGDLDAITGKALAKDPEDRYQSVAALADDVRRYLAGLPVSVRTPGAVERARRFVRRRPLAAAAIAGSTLATLSFAGIVTVLWLDARAARRSAEDARAATEQARAALESRANQLVLGTAREALSRDPTEAAAWLATLTPRDVDPARAWAVLDEAIARGVATDVLVAHTDEVHWVEALPGGAFVTGAYDGRALVWEPPAFAPRELVRAKHGRVHAVRPAPDHQTLAIGCDGGELEVITRDGTHVLAAPPGHAGDVQHLAWSSDGAWLATADDHGNTWVWPRGAAPGRRLTDTHAAIGTLAFSDDGRALVASDHEGHVWLWATGTWSARTAQLAGDPVTAWTDGTHVAIVDGDGTVHHWHAAGDALVEEPTVATHQRTKRAVFAKGGAFVVLGGIGGEVTRVEGTTVESLGVQHHALVRAIAISDDGRWIIDGADDGTLVVRDRSTGRLLDLRGHSGRIRHVDLAGDVILSSDSEGVVRRWKLPAGPVSLLEADAAVDRLASDGAHVAAVDTSGDVWSWTLADGRRARVGHEEGRVTALALAGGTVVTGTSEGAITWWTAAPVHRSVGGSVTAIASTGDRVAVATSRGPIALFAVDGAPAGEVAGNTAGTEAIAFAPRGELLASGGQDRELRLWQREGAAYRPATTIEGLHADVHHVAFTPSGDQVVAAGNDGAVLAWKLAGTRVLEGRTVAQHTGAVSALAIDPTGSWIVSAGRDHAIMRAPVAGGAGVKRTLGAAALALAVGSDGEVHAVTRTGTVERTSPAGAMLEIDHGARTALQLAPDRWLVARDDGAIVVLALGVRAFAQLPAAIAAATHVRVP